LLANARTTLAAACTQLVSYMRQRTILLYYVVAAGPCYVYF